MAVEYAPKGLIGLLTPQANTTVEPEYYILLPQGYAHINGRLMSGKPTIEERLVDYVDKLDHACDQFANAPIKAVAVGCTGASYLVGRERESRVLAEIERQRGVPAFTAATAVVASLRQLGARRIALASPYPAGLTEASKGYWESQGFTVSRIASAPMDHTQFHPIYSMKADTAGGLLHELAADDTDAILMLGTGMPTLRPLLAANASSRVPVLSCMLCLAWMGVSLADGQPAPLEPWLKGDHWKSRLPQG
ncbi:Maleate isomerase [Pigmentiphaga humi]|uniref:Maleate isomerase n=1 Tax=Pigmentiphaga humi TaxID=2478468 RepID=A0A3P4AYV6_9BURK|nr:aspartate/glutamate racemase family protein [Pigmentiphaga humi]VCU68751.1 Maleate isomerase [Pigmentiphaga humi]